MTPHHIADQAAGTALEAWFNRHPRITTAGLVAFILLLQVLGAWLDS